MTKLSAAGVALSGLVVEIFRANGLALDAGDRLTAPLGLSSARWQILGALDAPATIAQVARTMGRTRQSVRETSEALAREGFLSYADNPSHVRAKLLVLTERGQRALQEIEQRHVAWANRLGRALDLGTLEAALEGMQQVRAALEHELAAPSARVRAAKETMVPPARMRAAKETIAPPSGRVRKR